MFSWKRIERYDFPVKVVPLSNIVSEKYKLSLRNLRAIVRTDKNSVIAIVSKYYSFVPHKTVIESISSVLGKPQFVMLNSSGSRMYAFWKTEDREILGEKYSFGIIATNSYDGTKSINFSLFGLRLICSNGLYSEFILKKAKIIHKGERVLEKLSSFVSVFPKVIDVYISMLERMKNIEITKERVERLFDFLNLTKTQRDSIKRDLQYLRKERYNLFTVFNSVTYAISHLYRTRNIEIRIRTLRKLENYLINNVPELFSQPIPILAERKWTNI